MHKTSRLGTAVISLNHLHNSQCIQTVFGHFIFVQNHFQLTVLTSDFFGDGNIFYFLDFRSNLFGNLAQLKLVLFLAPKSQRQHRHIVNRTGFYHRFINTLRKHIFVFRQFVIQFYVRTLHVLTHIKLNNQHRLTVHCHRMHVFYAFDIRDNFFQRFGHTAFHFRRTRSRIAHHYVGHRNINLWFFLPWDKKRTVHTNYHQGCHQ